MQPEPSQKLNSLWVALVLLTAFFCVELAAGFWSNSLSLLADAEHILSDVAALGLTLIAAWLSRSLAKSAPRSSSQIEGTAALLNGLGLVGIALWIAKEAMERLQSPNPEILGVPMLITALVGLVVNLFNVRCLHRCSHQDLNIRGAFFHLLADVAGSIGTVLAAVAVIWLDWPWADGVMGLIVAGLISIFAASLVWQSLACLSGSSARPVPELCNCEPGSQNCQPLDTLLYPNLEQLVKGSNPPMT